MNKLMILAALAAATVAASAAEIRTPEEIRKGVSSITNQTERNCYVDAVTTDEWRAMLDDIIATAAADLKRAQRFANGGANVGPNVFRAISYRDAAKPLAAEYDVKLAAAGIGTTMDFYDYFPACCEKRIENHPEWAERYPVLIATVHRYKTWNGSSWTLAEKLNVHAEQAASGGWPKNSANSLLSAAPRAIKRALREKGMTFVAKEGEENPVQKPLDDLAAALNAPRMAGLAAWAKEWCPAHEWVEPKWMTDAEVKEFEDAIYYGEINFDDSAKTKLKAHIGIGAYNAFVEKYNGTVKE